MDILTAIRARRSIRVYTAEPVERDKLAILLEAAMAAPSGANTRPWEFVVVDDPASLDDLRNQLDSQYNATAAIVVCARPLDENSQRYWPLDCAAATQNIMLAAVGLGLGSCWISIYPKPDTMANVSAALGLPEEVQPFCAVILGYPAEFKDSHIGYDRSRVFWQRYGARS